MDQLTRRGLLGGAIAVAAVAVSGGTGAAASAAPRGTSASRPRQTSALWREFARTPYTHPQIPYVGRAGQRAGATAFPATGWWRTSATTARSDGSADAAPAINRAIAAAGERGGGTVVIPPGTYRIDDVIRIGHSNVVLRGAGSGRTTLTRRRTSPS